MLSPLIPPELYHLCGSVLVAVRGALASLAVGATHMSRAIPCHWTENENTAHPHDVNPLWRACRIAAVQYVINEWTSFIMWAFVFAWLATLPVQKVPCPPGALVLPCFSLGLTHCALVKLFISRRKILNKQSPIMPIRFGEPCAEAGVQDLIFRGAFMRSACALGPTDCS